MAQMLQKPVFALPGCQRMSVNTLLCDTLGLAERPRLRVKDVRAKNFLFLRSERWPIADGVKAFGSGCPPRYPPGRPRDIPPKNLMFRLLFRS